MSSRLKLEASGGLPCGPAGALMVPAGDALALLLLLLAPLLLPPPPLTPLPPPPAGCCRLLRPAGGFWRTWRQKEGVCVIVCVYGPNKTQIKRFLALAYLGVRQPQASHPAAAAAARLGVDGAQLLFDGAEVGHEGVQVHVLALVQRLCRHGGGAGGSPSQAPNILSRSWSSLSLSISSSSSSPRTSTSSSDS
ncbi:hypothetical protein EYF80_041786 [Liparis tanakae]|uniref:Uncharacterized protein n=1 Tax=Liparis tanakae TaxID=230148 RepID=A0A4Z2G5F7_9TELE|nr:hypothetical protein EYF80_041786 [Liparis tanakae]